MSIRIYGATSGYVDLDAPAVAGSASVTLPGSGTLALYSQLKVLQVVRATDSTNRTTTSTTFVDANISVTITPQKSDSAVLLVWSLNADSPSNVITYLAITDSSNNIQVGGEGGELYGASSRIILRQTVIAYATPATTSPVTYKGRFAVSSGTGEIQNAAMTGQLYAIEVAA